LWNGLSSSLKCSPTFGIFKALLCRSVTPETDTNFLKSITYSKVCYGNFGRLVTQFRLGLSPLRFDLYTYNINDNLFCPACGNSLETLVHFFFECICYAALRIVLFTELDQALECSSTSGVYSFDSFFCDQLIGVLTHGAHYDASNVNNNYLSVNKQIFASVSRFINSTCMSFYW